MHLRVTLYVAACVAVIGSNSVATGATRPRVVETTFAEFSVAPPTTDAVFVCYGFGCKYRVEINLTAADRAKLAQFLAAGRSSAAAERRAVAAAGAWFDKRVGPLAGTTNHVARAGMLGVGTFCYIATHLALFFADQSYSPAKFFHEITHRVYLIIGATAWLGLAALAATSTDGMVRRLGGLRWRRLHQAIYAIALLGLIHYFQQTKADVTVPIFAASLFLWLIGYRVLAWWQDTSELSTLSLLGLTIVVSLLTFAGEAIGIGIAFHVSPLRVLEIAFDFDAGIRPGWQVLAAGVVVVAIDAVMARVRSRAPRAREVAAE